MKIDRDETLLSTGSALCNTAVNTAIDANRTQGDFLKSSKNSTRPVMDLEDTDILTKEASSGRTQPKFPRQTSREDNNFHGSLERKTDEKRISSHHSPNNKFSLSKDKTTRRVLSDHKDYVKKTSSDNECETFSSGIVIPSTIAENEPKLVPTNLFQLMHNMRKFTKNTKGSYTSNVGNSEKSVRRNFSSHKDYINSKVKKNDSCLDFEGASRPNFFMKNSVLAIENKGKPKIELFQIVPKTEEGSSKCINDDWDLGSTNLGLVSVDDYTLTHRNKPDTLPHIFEKDDKFVMIDGLIQLAPDPVNSKVFLPFRRNSDSVVAIRKKSSMIQAARRRSHAAGVA